MPIKYTVKKGDTLNKIAQQHGFSNYREAGISSVPSGNFDLIREGEQINIPNYDPNKIQNIQQGSPVISSEDNNQKYIEEKAETERLKGTATNETATNERDMANEKLDVKTDETTKVSSDKTQESGSPINSKIEEWEQGEIDKFEDEADEQKKELQERLDISLARIDSTASSTIADINATYDRVIEQQKRINELNIARVKAYGLGGGGRFTPISFSDAITNREQEALDKITELDNKRNSLIAEAERARDEGRTLAMADNNSAIRDIDKQLQQALEDVRKEKESQYKLWRDYLDEENEKHEEALETMRARFVAVAPRYLDEYDNADEAGRDALIERLKRETGLDYATIFGILNEASYTALDRSLDIEKKRASIESTKELTKTRRENRGSGGKSGDDKDDDFSETDKKKLEQAGLQNASRQTKLDYLYGDDIAREEAKEKAETPEKSISDIYKGTGLDFHDEYADFRAQLRKGEILVKDKNGNIGAILEDEFDSKLYDKI